MTPRLSIYLFCYFVVVVFATFHSEQFDNIAAAAAAELLQLTEVDSDQTCRFSCSSADKLLDFEAFGRHVNIRVVLLLLFSSAD